MSARTDGYVIEHRACLVPIELPNETEYVSRPDISARSLRRMADTLGYEAIDIEHMRRVLRTLADGAEWQEQALSGHCCTTCGVVARHHPTCTAARRQAPAVNPFPPFDVRSGHDR